MYRPMLAKATSDLPWEGEKKHRHRKLRFVLATATMAAALAIHTSIAQNPPAPIPPYSVCSKNVNVLSLLPSPAGSPPNPTEDGDTQFLNSLIDFTEASLLQQVPTAASQDLTQQVQLLGKLFIYDKTESPAGNIACATCHASYAGFTGGTSIFNATTVAQAGGTAITNATSPGQEPRDPRGSLVRRSHHYRGRNRQARRRTGLHLCRRPGCSRDRAEPTGQAPRICSVFCRNA